MHYQGAGQSPQNGLFIVQWFNRSSIVLDTPHIDLFASHLNNQLPTFCSRHVNPQAWATDALSISWKGDPGLCISSNLSAPPCPREDRSKDMQDTSDYNFLAKTGLVSSTPGSPSLTTSGLAKVPRSPDTTNLQSTSSRSRQSLSLCLDAIKGLSDTAVALAAKSRRASTRKTYDNRLQHYIKWCYQKAVNPYSTSLTDIGDFFVRLFNFRLQIATIRG